MRDLWIFVGGVAVGILAVTGVFAMEEEGDTRPLDPSDEELEAEGEYEEEIEESEEEEKSGDPLIVQGG